MSAELPQAIHQDKQRGLEKELSHTKYNLKNKIGRITASSLMVVSSVLGLAATDEISDPDAAHAETVSSLNGFANNYPYFHAKLRDAATYDWWIDENNNGTYNNGESHSSLNYGYRNCTDGAAYWAKSFLGVNISGWGNAKNWNEAANSKNYLVKMGNANNIEPGDIAQSDDGTYGHVGIVTEVVKDSRGNLTRIKVAEINKQGDGTFSHVDYTNKNENGKFTRGSNKDWDHFIDLNGISTTSTDSDKDGFVDNVDKCPKIAGTIEGCPEGQPLVSLVPNYLGGNSAFMRGSDGRLYTSWQTGYGTGWEGWVPIGGNKITGAPTAINLNNGTHAIFVRGEKNQALTAFQTEAGSGQWHWADLGGALTSNIAVEDAITGGKVLFAKDNRGELVHKWQYYSGGNWSEWHSLGGSLLGDPNVLRTADGRHVVYARGTNGHLMTKWQQSPGGVWSPWTDLGGELTSSPVAQWMNNGAMVVFARDSQGRITHKWQLAPESGQWSEWVPLTNKTLSGPAVAKESDGRFSIYYADENGLLQTDWQIQPGSTWLRASLGAAIVGTPEIERSPAGALSEYAPNYNGVVTTKWQTAPGSTWIGPATIGQVIYPAW